MTPEARLAEIITALEGVGLTVLVMGGHAVRYYGVDRNTIDFDLHLSPDRWDELAGLLSQTSLFTGQTPVEGPSWRPHSFRRYQIGRLPDGREEWLEFWKSNHLLAPFGELYARRETGRYGGRYMDFLSLPDLIRSKETERNTDWQDVALLEEVLDARLAAEWSAGSCDLGVALARLRSRRGFERLLQSGGLSDAAAVRAALEQTQCTITQAFLLPFAPQFPSLPAVRAPIEPIIVRRLKTIEPGSSLHLTLVEAVRRQYKTAMQGADRADKEVIRESTIPP